MQAADADWRIVPEKRCDPGHGGKLRAQFVDDLVDLRALGARLQADVEVPLVHGSSAPANSRHYVGDRRILHQDFADLFLVLHHGVKRNALNGFGGPVDLIDILARQKALRNDDRKIVRPDRQGHQNHHRCQLVPKHDLKATVVSFLEPHLHGLKEVVEAAVLYLRGEVSGSGCKASA